MKSEKLNSEYIQTLIKPFRTQYPGLTTLLSKMLSEIPEERGTFAQLADEVRSFNKWSQIYITIYNVL